MTEDDLPRDGDTLLARYRVDQLLGKGGMGAVLAAVDTETGERVAIKLILPELAEDIEARTRFLREARAVAALRSEHAVRFRDIQRDADGRWYLIMERLEGVDLGKHCRERGPLPIDEAVGHLLQACDAIAEAHSLGILHRDLKPQNLFLAQVPGGRPAVKVLDFGLAKAMIGALSGRTGSQGLTETGALMGSPSYMPPEQLRSSRRVDARSDVWALGMILHKLLTGGTAFDCSSIGELLRAIATTPPVPLRARLPDAPEELEAIILRCLQKDPARRFQNAGQLAAALAPFSPETASVVLPRIASLVGEEGMSAPLLPLETPDSGPAEGAANSSREESTVPVNKKRAAPVAEDSASCLGALAVLGALLLTSVALRLFF